MKNPILALCLSAIIALPVSSAVADSTSSTPQVSAEHALNDLYAMRLATQRSIGGFYMFNGQEQDQHYAREAQNNAAQALAYLNKITAPTDPNAQALLQQLQHDLSSYKAQLDYLISAIIEQGYSDLQPVADLANLNSKILKIGTEAEQLISQDANYSLPELTQLAREQSLLMQGIAADYAARSASVGASFFADGEKQPLDQLSERFANNLQLLLSSSQNTPATSKSLRAIEVKWRYIERSLKNYNENSVPFVIDKYARSITQGLEQLATEYALLNI